MNDTNITGDNMHPCTPTSKNQFPTNIFPEEIENFIIESSDKLGFDINYLSTLILVVASTAIGKKAKIKVKDFYEMYPSIYLILIGQPGAAKTPCINYLFKPIDEKSSEEYEKYKIQKRKYLGLKEEEKSNEEPPTFNQLKVGDVTTEALTKALGDNPNGLCLVRDEIIGWIKDMNKYNGGGSDREYYLSAWSQDNITVNRKSEEPRLITSPFLNVIGGIQPEILNSIINSDLSKNGFTARILWTINQSTRKKFSSESVRQESYEEYSKLINRLLSLDEIIIPHSTYALDYFENWFEYNVDCMENEPYPPIKEAYSKLDIYIHRLSLIIELINNNSNEIKEVSEESMSKAIEVVEYFRNNCKQVLSSDIELKNQTDIEELKDNIIERLIDDYGFSQVKIGKLLGISRQTVGKRYNRIKKV